MALSEVRAPIHKNRNTTMGRVRNFYQTGQLFSSFNLSSKLYGESKSAAVLEHFPILGPHGSWKNVSHEEIEAGPWTPVSTGQSFGPTWTTHWFHVRFDPPGAEWNGKEVHLRFASGSEAMVYNTDFHVLQGISPGYREEYILTKSWDNANPTPLEFYIEMACNDMFGQGRGDLIAPPNPDRFFNLGRCEIAVFNRENFLFTVDFDQINGIAQELGNTHIGYQAMFSTNEMVNQITFGNTEKAKEISEAFFQQGTGDKAHTLYAMGHCHIDSAWLWPYDETIRKCARSFSAQLGLMDEYPGIYKFVCSQAQQFEWVEQYYPDLFAKIAAKVTSGEFVPVGGTWVEMDGNMPSGESFMRQYYYGQNYFQEKFGITCKEFWLPDTFGYSAQIPQMLKHVGITRFLTQKMSWNLVNQFPNHNFWWEGIDGTKVMVHFPPGNSYNMNGLTHELLNSQNNSLDKGRANVGVYLYGYGDGGGGPTRQMIERLIRMQNVDGIPRVKFGDSNEFFEELEKDSDKFYKWVGELYLELHNGTYTSQAKIKWYNRKCEFLLREVELLMAMAYSMGKVDDAIVNVDVAQVDKCWKDFLLNQFHDVLPGSCIEFVAQDAWKIYEDLMTPLFDIRGRYHGHIFNEETRDKKGIFNYLPWSTKTVAFFKPDSGNPPSGPNVQNVLLSSTPFEGEGEGMYRVPASFAAALVDIAPNGYSELVPLAPTNPVSFAEYLKGAEGFRWGLVTLRVSEGSGGLPVEELLFDGENMLPAFNDYLEKGISPGMFYIYDDIPMYWDAWDVMDYHIETRKLPNFTEITRSNVAEGPLVGGYKFSAKFGNGSSVERYTILRADSPMIEYYTIVDWHEDHKMLKAEFPMDVLSRDATFEIQYGHAKRPTHINTSWDMAKFEVCGHKWMDISQADKGVSILTDCKYGWHVRENQVSLSLLKSPKNPDANCDMGKHYIYYAVLPHKGRLEETSVSQDVIRKAYELNTIGCNNVPLIDIGGTQLPTNFVLSSNPAAVIEAVKISKPTNTREKTLCVRVYEAFGGYADTMISFEVFTINEVRESNGLEDLEGTVIPHEDNGFSTSLKPFQIRSFLVAF